MLRPTLKRWPWRSSWAALALGSVLFGRRADRSERPLRTYVILEVLIGGYCLLLPLLVELAGMGYVSLATQFFDSPGIKIVLRFGLVILLVLFPAVLMGGTLPILARRLISRVEQTQRQVANPVCAQQHGCGPGGGTGGICDASLLGNLPLPGGGVSFELPPQADCCGDRPGTRRLPRPGRPPPRRSERSPAGALPLTRDASTPSLWWRWH